MTELTIEHFLKVHEMLAGYYGTHSPKLEGVAIAFKALKDQVPSLTAEQFDFAVSRALTTCRFHPRLADLLDVLFDKDRSSLPALPDIDVRYADSYQQNVYYQAVNNNNKLAANCPPNTNYFRDELLGQIPGTTAVGRHSLAPSVEEWNRKGTLDAGGSRPALSGTDSAGEGTEEPQGPRVSEFVDALVSESAPF